MPFEKIANVYCLNVFVAKALPYAKDSSSFIA